MKTAVKRCIKKIMGRLAKAGLPGNEIILRMDGGICSQMHFYLAGRLLVRKGNKVSYDLDWYETEGMDLDGRFCRNFDLLKLFPTLPFPVCTNRAKKKLYVTSCYRYNDYFGDTAGALDWQSSKAPLYLAGYFRDTEPMYGELFDECFGEMHPELDAENRKLAEEIESAEKNGEPCCAIHVRRGDLAQYNPAYGVAPESAYFRKAIEAIRKKSGDNTKFYIFSDEPEWCASNLQGAQEAKSIKICDKNGSDKGYIDLYLMSRCRHIVCSQGSMGKYAALLRCGERRKGLVILPPNETSEEWRRRFADSQIPD